MFSVKAVFLFVVLYLGCIVMANEDMKDDNIDRGSRSDRGSLWFGPRLGKRSLNLNSEDNRQSFSRLLEAADDLKHYYDQLSYYEPQADEPLTKDIKNVIFTPRRSLVEDKRYDSMDFLPRLGRRLAAQMAPTPSEQDTYHVVVEPVGINRFRYSPRLGRNVNFSPRLGRELSYDYPGSVRVVRSANKTKTT